MTRQLSFSLARRLGRLLASRPALFAAPLLLLLGGCTPSLKSDVVTFHEGPLPKGETIRVVPADPDKRGSLEFEHYAKLIREHLRKIGYTPVAQDQPSLLLAEVDYGVSEGVTEVRTEPRGYAHYHFYYGRFYDPFYYGFYPTWTWQPEVVAQTVYNRRLTLNIVSPELDGTDRVLFEGRVQSTGSEQEIARVMPYMITAMFNNFPGESGVTKVVTIEKNH
jgi:hypothetical protein